MSKIKPYYFELQYGRGAGAILVHRWCKWTKPIDSTPDGQTVTYRTVYVEQRTNLSSNTVMWRIGIVATTKAPHKKSHKRAFDKAFKEALDDILN